MVYPSYWHARLKTNRPAAASPDISYLAQKPNYGAGIGHQLANWNSGYFYARYFGLQFAHFAFSNKKWEQTLGFGEGEVSALTLLHNRKLKKVQLPLFNGDDPAQVNRIKQIIRSYRGKQVFFLLEQDQAYMEQCATYQALS